MDTDIQKAVSGFAKTAMTKRADNTLQNIVQWFQSMPAEQRNAVIGSLLGGAGAGATSAAADGNVIADALLGAGLGAGAGYGGTKAYQHIRQKSPIPSAVMNQDWDEVRDSLPPDAVGKAVNTGTNAAIGGAAGFGAGKWLENLYRQVGGMADAQSPFKGGVEGVTTGLSSKITGGNPYHVMRNRARQVADAIAFEEMHNNVSDAADSMNPYKKWKAWRRAKTQVPQRVVERMTDEMGHLGGPSWRKIYGNTTMDSPGVKEVLRTPGKSVRTAFKAGRRASKGLKVPRFGRYGALLGLGVPLAASVMGGDDSE